MKKKEEITEYRYLPHGKPMPEGWVLASKLENCRHGHFAVLIKRKALVAQAQPYETKGKETKEIVERSE